MKQIWIVLKQEYLNRIRKRSFIVLTLLGPLLSLCMVFIPFYLSMNTAERIHVWLHTNDVQQQAEAYSDQTFVFHQTEEQDSEFIQQQFLQAASEADLLADISIKNPGIRLWDKKGLSVSEQWLLKKKLQQIYTDATLMLYKPDAALMPHIQEVRLADPKKNADIMQLTGLFAAIVIYFFIFYYGVQVMKGIVDEKVNRVVEVILCSVKPFYWMMGKILGIAAICLTQFSFWILIYIWVGSAFSNKYSSALDQFDDTHIAETLQHTNDSWQALEWNMIVQSVESVPLMLMGISFLLFFLLGYLLYASLFAAIGAMTDNETDTQQFTFPITAPLFLTFLFAGFIISEPDSRMAIMLSYFPLTSPVAMMLRIPFGIERWEIILSLAVLLITFVAAVYIASGIFKRGVLQYGKALTWKSFLKKH